MAAASEQLGNATILGGSINPLQVYMGQQAARQKQAAADQEQAKKDRDAIHDYMDKYKPEAKWDPLKQRIAQRVNEIRDKTYNLLDNAGNDTRKISAVERDARRSHGLLNEYIGETDAWKADYDAASKIIEDNIKAGLYKPESRSILRDVLYDNTGKLKDDNDIRAGMSQLQAIVEHPNNYDKNGVAISFMKGLPEKTNQYYTEVFNPLGQQYNIADTKTKLGLQTDNVGNIVMDPRTGMPKINMTDDVYIQAMQDPMLSKIVQQEVPNGTVAQNKAYLSALLEGYDPKEVKNRPQLGFKEAEADRRYYIFGRGGYGYKFPEADLRNRDELLNRVVSGTSGNDVLAYFGKLANDVRAGYSSKDAQGNKGKFIRLEYTQGSATNPATGYTQKSKEVVYLPINTEEEKRTAKVALSQRMDEIDKKRAIGEDYPRYINDLRKMQDEKNKKAGSGGSLNATLLKSRM